MADQKLADLTALTAPSGDDLLYVVDDPAGTPSDKKLALDNLFTRGTVTVSSPVIDAAQTWNDGGVTFTGLKFNATDTASAAASLLMDLQVGGASAFNVSKAGSLKLGINSSGTNVAGTSVVVAGSQGTGSGVGGHIIFQVSAAGSSGTSQNNLTNSLAIIAPNANQSTNQLNIGWNGNGPMIYASNLGLGSAINTYYMYFVPGGFSVGGTDAYITRRGAANLRLGTSDAAAPVAQTLSVQSVVAGTTNTAGANLTITGSQGTGTGAGGSIIFQVAPAGSSGTAQNALATVLTIASSRLVTFAGNVDINDGNLNVGLNGVGTITTRGLRINAAQTLSFSDGNDYLRGIATNTGGGLAITNNSTGGQSLEFREMTAPAAPATNNVRIYAVDNGSGKTQLMALFATGAAQQIAIEP